MKEHRTKALRVTTPHSIESSGASNKDEFGRENGNDLFGALQILQFELAPSRSNSPPENVADDSRQSSSSRMPDMTTNTATFTANPTFGKHDSFYRWFSSDFQSTNNDDEDDNRRYECTHICAKSCEQSLQQNWKTCGCRSVSTKRRNKYTKSVSASSIHHSLSFLHTDQSYLILDLVSGDLNDNWFLKIRDIKEAISRAKSCSWKNEWHRLRDDNGNTALLVSGQKLLRDGNFDKAVELVKILLEEGSDVNVINNENRTLLSYSIQYMDKSIRLSTLLINYGATVWPIPANVELPVCSSSDNSDKYASGSNCNSAFTWFLRSIIRQLKLSEHCLQTLYLLAEVMGENPELMHSHVMSTMFSHAKCYSILGPVFLQIKLAMSPYWTQPQSLKFLCKSIIRKSIIDVPGRFVNAENLSSLMLPPSLQSYLMLEC